MFVARLRDFGIRVTEVRYVVPAAVLQDLGVRVSEVR